MKEKIKSLLLFAGEAWRGSMRGKIGLLMVLFALFAFGRMFVGTTSVQGFVQGTFRLASERRQLTAEQARLAAVDEHIRLIQTRSPDFIEELAQKHLNMGDPNLRILR
jgi:cell division protein FtsB